MIISFDTETTGIDLHYSCRPFLFTICDDNGPVYWEWDVDPKTRKPRVNKGDLQEVADRLNEAEEIALQNAKFDIRACETVGLDWEEEWWDKVQDTLFSGHILGSAERHDLTVQSLKYLRTDITDVEEELKKAVQEARTIARRDYPNWKIAHKKLQNDGCPSIQGDEPWKWDMWLPRAVAKFKKYPADHPWWTVTANYANTDTSVTLPLWKLHKSLLGERNLWSVYQMRRSLIREIYDMETVGVTYSEKRLEELKGRFEGESAEDEAECLALSGGRLESLPKSGTTKAMRELLFDVWEAPVVKVSGKTKEPSVDKTVLDNWRHTLDPETKLAKFVTRLKRKRARDTAVSYMTSYQRYALPHHNDIDFRKIHPSLNATGQVTLRFSSQNPNEQNISKLKDKDTPSIRYCFGPAKGREWWSADYENIELRIPAYEAGETEMVALFERSDDPPYYGSYHLLIFETLHPKEFKEYGADVKTVFKDTLYQWTKNGNFAVQYGAMEESGTADRAYHMPGAQRRIKERFSKVAQLNQTMIDLANAQGYVETMYDYDIEGCYPIQTPREGKWNKIRPTVPLNYHVQSTAMWCMCKAMLRCGALIRQWNREAGIYDLIRLRRWEEVKARGFFMVMQVHDELVFDFPKGKTPRANLWRAEALREAMEQSGRDINVPLRVDVSYHPNNWAEAVDPLGA